MFKFNSIQEAIEDIKEGKIVVVIDDPDRENEGDLLMAAEKVTGEAINFMAKYGRGLICMPVEEERLKELNVHPMVEKNTDNHETAFTVAIDHVDTTTGISAFERALTIQKVLEDSKPEDFRRPGHVFPLIAKSGGVLERIGHTEAAVDLPKLAGLKPAGVICEIMNDDGTMARTPELMEFAKTHNLKIITIADLVKYRKEKETETLVERVVEVKMPTKFGDFKMYGFVNQLNGEHHVALVKGDITGEKPVLIRVHSECLTGDALGSKRCDCGEQYDAAMKKIAEEGSGILLYMRQEGRGIGLINKLKAYELQDQGFDTVEANIKLGFPADMRSYDVAAAILKDLGVKKVRLMTNNPRKINGLEDYDLKVVERVPIQMNHNEKNEFYLKTKQQKLNHMLSY
ncbi:bifunctional 3,4-dihydroxy-2-butanone-4-phosphate synthase/GTP cyclohydrolase II [Clostridium sp.]|uniref:bifunctional 3,4-dihydroxy-2-butanone-4-phosphate synthase/GTP cyclohydrolase II n=1 Tax=Clostridium sp. TaxID=1506 RepID=UPI0032170859